MFIRGNGKPDREEQKNIGDYDFSFLPFWFLPQLSYIFRICSLVTRYGSPSVKTKLENRGR